MATKRTDDLTRWGSGVGRDLTAAEADVNFWDLEQAVLALQTSRPQPNDIVSIAVTGASMDITLTDGTVLGPIKLPVAAIHWRNEWVPFTVYEILDFVTVEGLGIYSVEVAHTSAASFDADLILSDQVYRLVWAFGDAPATGVVYDIGFEWQGLLSDADGDRLWDFPAVREFLIPASGDQHVAVLREEPSTAAQVFPIYHDGVQIGEIAFAIGERVGTVTIDADETFVKSEVLEVGAAPLIDATAKGLSVVFAAQRVV